MKRTHFYAMAICEPGVEPIDMNIDPGIIYLLGPEGGPPELVCFQCPCGCGHKLDLPLAGGPSRPGRDTWHMQRVPGQLVSLSPSIHVKGGCGAHFHVKNGQIEWCT